MTFGKTALRCWLPAAALLLALLTTVAAYLIMMLAPFPGIRQMAIFAAIGLSASCMQSRICTVSRSCTCKRRAKHSTTRATFERPVM